MLFLRCPFASSVTTERLEQFHDAQLSLLLVCCCFRILFTATVTITVQRFTLTSTITAR